MIYSEASPKSSQTKAVKSKRSYFQIKTDQNVLNPAIRHIPFIKAVQAKHKTHQTHRQMQTNLNPHSSKPKTQLKANQKTNKPEAKTQIPNINHRSANTHTDTQTHRHTDRHTHTHTHTHTRTNTHTHTHPPTHAPTHARTHARTQRDLLEGTGAFQGSRIHELHGLRAFQGRLFEGHTVSLGVLGGSG